MKVKMLIATLAAMLALATMAATAGAMTSKIDQRLAVSPAGVQAGGPMTGWESDEASAVIHVTVTQAGRSVAGTTRSYASGASRWSTLATGDRLAPGAAVGHATATVTLTGGSTETYSWTVAVTLVR
jgi:hypothetical protein